jgi:hypothetical protein
MSTWGDVAATVAKVAPILGNILPGVGTVVGAGVGAAASMVASALGVSADPDSVMSALKNDPEALAKVRTCEIENQTALAQIAAQREAAQLAAQTAQYQADAADRQSARAMATADKEHTPRNLAYIYTFALIFVIAAHFYIVIAKIVIDPAAFTILGNIEGVLIAMVLGSKEFYFGSSSSAVKQQAAITDFATTPGAVTAPASTTTTTIQSPSNQPQAVTVAPADNLYRGS